MGNKLLFLAGGIIGTVAGMLFTRQSGAELRKKLAATKNKKEAFGVMLKSYATAGKSALSVLSDSRIAKDMHTAALQTLKDLEVKKEGMTAASKKAMEKKTKDIMAAAKKTLDAEMKKVSKKRIKKKVKKAVSASVAATKKSVAATKKKVAAARKKVARRK